MKKRSFFHTVRVMFPMAFHAAPLRFILINVLGISQSVVMGANTLLLSNFVNELIASVGKGRFEAALIAATAFYVCGIIGYQLLNTLFNYALTKRIVMNLTTRFRSFSRWHSSRTSRWMKSRRRRLGGTMRIFSCSI